MKCVYIIEWIGQQIFPKAINRTPATNLAVCNKILDLFGDITCRCHHHGNPWRYYLYIKPSFIIYVSKDPCNQRNESHDNRSTDEEGRVCVIDCDCIKLTMKYSKSGRNPYCFKVHLHKCQTVKRNIFVSLLKAHTTKVEITST